MRSNASGEASERNDFTSSGVGGRPVNPQAARRIKVRGASVRRYVKRYRLLRRTGTLEEIKASVRSWIGHVSHADSWRLRAAVLGGRKRARHPA